MLDMGSEKGEGREKGVLLAKPLAGRRRKGEGAVEADDCSREECAAWRRRVASNEQRGEQQGTQRA